MLKKLIVSTVVLTALATATGCGGKSEVREAGVTPEAAKTSTSAPPDASEAKPTEASAQEFVAQIWDGVEKGRYQEVCALQTPAYAATDDAPCVDSIRSGAKEVHDAGYTYIPTDIQVTVRGNKATAKVTLDLGGPQVLTQYLTFTNGKWLLSGDDDTGDMG